MDIKEKIKESAKRYAGITPDVTDIYKLAFSSNAKHQMSLHEYNSFSDGANFALKEAFRWRDVKTEPPKENGETYYILVTNDPDNVHDTGIFAFREVRYLVKTRKYWRPINLEDL